MKHNFTTLISACLIIFSPSQSYSQLPYPTKYPTAVIPHNGDGGRFPFLYMPFEYQDNSIQDTFRMYYVIRNPAGYKYYLARSIDYGITWSDTQRVIVPSEESIVKVPDSTKLYMAYGTRIMQASFMNTSESTDGGFNFSNNSQTMELGEDKSFIWFEDTGEYWGYVRPYNIEPSCCGIYDPPTCISYGDVFNGSDLASGVYFYKLSFGDFVQTKKLSLIK